MRTENKKYYLIALLWLVCGYLSWVLGVYLFTYGPSNLVLPISRYISTTFHSYFISILTTFMLFYTTDFILIFLVTVILSIATGTKLLWVIVFLVGAIGRTLYGTISGIIFYMNYYDTLPIETRSWIFQSIAAHLIITPFIAWLGVFIGQKYRTAEASKI